jgi:hypothetical protein
LLALLSRLAPQQNLDQRMERRQLCELQAPSSGSLLKQDKKQPPCLLAGLKLQELLRKRGKKFHKLRNLAQLRKVCWRTLAQGSLSLQDFRVCQQNKAGYHNRQAQDFALSLP